MHQINLNEKLFQAVRERATAAGFENVDDYVADVLQEEVTVSENFDHLFTPERLAHIEESLQQIRDGKGLSLEEARAELAKRRDEWLRQKS